MKKTSIKLIRNIVSVAIILILAIGTFAVAKYKKYDYVNTVYASEPSPEQESPGQDSPGQESPGQESPGQESPGQESPGQESPGQESPGQDSPGQDSPGQDDPNPPEPPEEPKIRGYRDGDQKDTITDVELIFTDESELWVGTNKQIEKLAHKMKKVENFNAKFAFDITYDSTKDFDSITFFVQIDGLSSLNKNRIVIFQENDAGAFEIMNPDNYSIDGDVLCIKVKHFCTFIVAEASVLNLVPSKLFRAVLAVDVVTIFLMTFYFIFKMAKEEEQIELTKAEETTEK